MAWQQLIDTILLALYSLLLRLFPRPFREAFAEEMTDVFARRMEEMAQDGFSKLFRLCVHEYADLSLLLLAERWNQLRQRGKETKGSVDIVPAPPSTPYTTGTPSSWSGALLAGLPHLLVPTFFLTGWLLGPFDILDRGPSRHYLGICFSALVALMLLVAWKRRWPRWSGSWVGYASASLFILLLGALTYLFNAYPFLVEYAAIVENAPILVWLVSSIVIVVLLARRDSLAGLLAILSIFLVLTQIFLDEVRGDEPLFLGIALVTAAVAMIIARTRRPFAGLGLVLATYIPIAFLVSYYSIYRSTSLPVEPSYSLVIRSTIASLILFSLWLIPILLLFTWRRLSQRY